MINNRKIGFQSQRLYVCEIHVYVFAQVSSVLHVDRTRLQAKKRNGWRKKGPAAQDRQSAETAESVQTADLDFDVFPSKATHSARSVVRLVTRIIRPCLNR